MLETPADRLRSAAARVRAEHTTGELCDADGNVCALGALLNLRDDQYKNHYPAEYAAAEMLLSQDRIAADAAEALRVHLGEPVTPARSLPDIIALWNDHIAPVGEIARAMEDVAAKWEADHGC